MKAEQAWKSALEQLQMEMPKATYDSWVSEASFVSYDEGIFEIGAANEYTRAWLEGRLSSTATRLLTGLMNRTVQVRFVALPPDPLEEDDSQVTPSSTRFTEDEKQYKIKLAHASLRDEFVHPQRVTVIPAYFQRWLPYLGPTLAWIVVAFRQVMYLATHQEARPEVSFSVSPTSLARWAGIYRTTLWRRLDDRPLGWFLKRIQRDCNVFRFVVAMPLTPGDAQALSQWMAAAGARADPIAALEQALGQESGFSLPSPPSPPTPDQLEMEPNPQSVQEVVLWACGRIEKKAVLNKVLKLADQLSARLMPPGDAIHVTHYFLLHHLPELGAAPAWLVTLLRDRCFSGKDDPRDFVWIRGGYAEIARMLGLQRPKTVSEWLPAVFTPDHGRAAECSPSKNGRQARRSLLQQFITRAEYKAGFGTASCGFKVSLIEPLSPEDQAIYDWILDQAGAYLESGDWLTIEARLQPSEEARPILGGAHATIVQPGRARMQPGLARLQQDPGAVATGPGEDATDEGRACNPVRRGCNALNPSDLLIKLIQQLDSNSINSAEALPDTNFPASEGGAVVVDPSWELQALFSRNPSVKVSAQKNLVQHKAGAQAFVSWLLYAASPYGKGIARPDLFAASKLSVDPGLGAGGSYDLLAALQPKDLYALIQDALTGGWNGTRAAPGGQADWQAVMAGARPERLQALKKQLFK